MTEQTAIDQTPLGPLILGQKQSMFLWESNGWGVHYVSHQSLESPQQFEILWGHEAFCNFRAMHDLMFDSGEQLRMYFPQSHRILCLVQIIIVPWVICLVLALKALQQIFINSRSSRQRLYPCSPRPLWTQAFGFACCAGAFNLFTLELANDEPTETVSGVHILLGLWYATFALGCFTLTGWYMRLRLEARPRWPKKCARTAERRMCQKRAKGRGYNWKAVFMLLKVVLDGGIALAQECQARSVMFRQALPGTKMSLSLVDILGVSTIATTSKIEGFQETDRMLRFCGGGQMTYAGRLMGDLYRMKHPPDSCARIGYHTFGEADSFDSFDQLAQPYFEGDLLASSDYPANGDFPNDDDVCLVQRTGTMPFSHRLQRRPYLDDFPFCSVKITLLSCLLVVEGGNRCLCLRTSLGISLRSSPMHGMNVRQGPVATLPFGHSRMIDTLVSMCCISSFTTYTKRENKYQQILLDLRSRMTKAIPSLITLLLLR